MRKSLAVFLLFTGLPGVAIATETVTYTYDAKGRLTQVERAGTINNNITTTYTLDKADNRTNVKTTGAAS